jgi:hypothetical protein
VEKGASSRYQLSGEDSWWAPYYFALPDFSIVMPALDAGIHVLLFCRVAKTWMAGSSQVKPGHDDFLPDWRRISA